MSKEKKTTQVKVYKKAKKILKLYNPSGMNMEKHSIKSIEFDDECTRIDFIYRSPNYYANGGWIQMERNSFIRPCGSNTKYPLIGTRNITIAPEKKYFQRCGQIHIYTLIFPALPKDTVAIDIIEREEPGTYFNFYNVKYSNWVKIPHPFDIPRSKN